MKKNIIAVVGNPNCGKTTLFNGLTGSHQTVGNWPGVTVEQIVGEFTYKDRQVKIVDLPGIYSLQPSSASSEDERVARDYILQDEAELIVNIVDASNLERNLYLTTQLIEMQVPMIVVLNMLDMAEKHQLSIDPKKLRDQLGCPVIGIVAAKERGLKELCAMIDSELNNLKVPPNPIRFSDKIEKARDKIAALLEKQGVERGAWTAEQLLEGDAAMDTYLKGVDLTEINQIIDETDKAYEGNLDIEMADVRYQFVSKVTEACLTRNGEVTQSTTDKIDKIVLNRWLGIPIFLLIMYLMFVFSINIGSAFIDFFDILFGAIFVQGFGNLLTSWGTHEWLKTILADGIGGGIQTVSTFIPVIACLFLSLSFLEDSGYMARAAFVMDRMMRFLGLPGKSFVPLIVGFGCGVPAIMAARTMEKKSDRITTVMMAPFMSCGARLPVYVLFATTFWPLGGQNLVFSLYLIGILVAIITGFILKRTALRDEAGAFVMEIPPYHMPTIKNLALRTWDRLKSFILKAGQLIVIIVAVLAFLNSLGTDGSFGNEDTDKSVLSQIGKTIVPAFEPMGLSQENWPAAVGVFTGILAKEAVVGTLDSLYSGMGDKMAGADEKANDDEDEPFSLAAEAKRAVDSVGENLSEIGTMFIDPLGTNVEKDLTDVDEQAALQEVGSGTFRAMKTLFDGELGAFSYLLMVLLYIPCCASIGAMYREVGSGWTAFAAGWTLVVGYGVSTIVYQIGRFSAHPVFSGTCIALSAAAILAFIVGLRIKGRGD
ncbi:Fe(2+) transporter permease subunit FeoB [Parasutterella muris]|jgi:ferrous iron transporter FeoB|uniref:Ferrous iron transport protein B n=2 Tax=Parasutterella TaxID=577310 RepID=A0A6L6YNG8_9BURK|nr:Fe(2+) transporter permease subunit FeoB [Parasutterella muris]MVX56901.1 Fe(2+) transporter permease subunit FeoB [Parasutterella muris]